MLLIVTSHSDVTADFLEERLQFEQRSYFRFNTESFPVECTLTWSHTNGTLVRCFQTPTRQIDLAVIRSIWWRRPFEPGPQIAKAVAGPMARDFAKLQTNESLEMLWEDIDCLWVNNPAANKRANSKLLQLNLARCIGFKTPPTLLTNSVEVARSFIAAAHGSVVIKTLRQKPIEIGGKCFGFYTSRIENKHERWFDSIKYAPVFLQHEVKKQFELRITVVGEEVFAARIDSKNQKLLDWREIDPTQQNWRQYNLPQEIQQGCIKLLRELNLKFGAIDMIVTPTKEYVFLEINPNGQWAWLEIEAGLPISTSLIRLLYG